MLGMTLSRAAQITGGRFSEGISEDRMIRQIVIDSRAVQPSDLFVAYHGEHTDGHRYISAAFDRGASCCLAEIAPEDEKRPVILVEDVQKAIEKLAAAYRKDFDIPIIGVTGSVGKTTAKEMIAAVLQQRFQTLKTEGNLNNQIGIPMMLSRLDETHEAAVIEMGISGFGEMSTLAAMTKPTIAVFTVIGHAHLEFLHDLDGVLKAKTEMLDYMPDTAPVIVNGDDEKLFGLVCRQRKITYGLEEHCDVRAIEIKSETDHTKCKIICGNRSIPVQIPAFGRHMVYAALAASCVGMLLGLDDEKIAKGISLFQNVSRRGDLIQTGWLKIFDDSYNANPDSVKCAIDSLVNIPGSRHVCILGDMLEQGEESAAMHEEVGRYAAEQGVDLLLTSGSFAEDFCRGAGKIAKHFRDRETLIAKLKDELKYDDCVLVKASKGAHYEYVAAEIRTLGSAS